MVRNRSAHIERRCGCALSANQSQQRLAKSFTTKVALYLKKVCYKVSLCEYCQRQSCKAFTCGAYLSVQKWFVTDVPFYNCLQNIVFHFWPKLTHPAARSVRDSWATCFQRAKGTFCCCNRHRHRGGQIWHGFAPFISCQCITLRRAWFRMLTNRCLASLYYIT